MLPFMELIFNKFLYVRNQTRCVLKPSNNKCLLNDEVGILGKLSLIIKTALPRSMEIHTLNLQKLCEEKSD